VAVDAGAYYRAKAGEWELAAETAATDRARDAALAVSGTYLALAEDAIPEQDRRVREPGKPGGRARIFCGRRRKESPVQTVAVIHVRDSWRVVGCGRRSGPFKSRIDAEEAALRLCADVTRRTGQEVTLLVQERYGELREVGYPRPVPLPG
jgi:hypothetical protein